VLKAGRIKLEDDEICGNPVMTFPIQKRINAELFIDRTAAQYILEIQIRDGQ